MNATIKTLTNYLNYEGLVNDYDNFFEKIAIVLMNDFVITKKENQYQIVEIEFYLFTPEHPDIITYPRSTEAGKWFFHQSGVDLTFLSKQDIFGGILIRGLKDLKSGKLILGPLKCAKCLLDSFDAIEPIPDEYPHLTKNNQPIDNIPEVFQRWIPDTKGKTPQKRIEEWKKRLCLNNEFSDAEIAQTVFESRYRFMTLSANDKKSNEWKKYSAKPRNFHHTAY